MQQELAMFSIAVDLVVVGSGIWAMPSITKEFTVDSVIKGHSWQCSKDYIYSWGSNWGQMCSKQASYPLY